MAKQRLRLLEGSNLRLCTLLLALLTLAICFAPTQAALVERDFLVPGDGLLVYDTVNRREWLDLAVTERVDLAGLAAALAPGGPLEGFSLATIDDVEALAASAGVSWVDGLPLDFDSYDSARHWIEILDNPSNSSNTSSRDWFYPEHEHRPASVHLTVNGYNEPFEIDQSMYQGLSGFTGISSAIYIAWGLRTVRAIVFDLARSEIDVNAPPLSSTLLSITTTRNTYRNAFYHVEQPEGGIQRSTDFRADKVIGPYWLTRSAVPEPSGLSLLLSVSLTFVCRRRR